MYDMRQVTPEEFQAFLVGKELTTRKVGPALHYLEAGEFPDNVVATYLPASDTRKRATGWRVAIMEPAQ